MFRQTEEELVADHERVRQLYELQVKMNFLWHEIDVLERSDEAHEGDGPAWRSPADNAPTSAN